MSQTANTIQPRAYGITDAARYLSVHRSTIYRLAHGGELSIKKIAGRAVVLKDDLDNFLDSLPPTVGGEPS